MTLLIHFLAFLTVFAVTLSLQKFLRYRAYRLLSITHRCQDPPKEGPYDIFGIFKIIRATRHLLNKTALANTIALFERYGETYASKVLTQTVFFTCDPRNIRHVLITRFVDYDSSVVRVHLFRPITEHGIFAVDGVDWKLARSLYRNQFANTRSIMDFDMHEKHFQSLLCSIPSTGEPFDLQPLFLNLTLDITTAFALGDSVDSLSPAQSDEKRHFVKALLYVKRIMARNGFLGPIHLLLSKREFYNACSDVHRYVGCIIERALDEKQEEDEQSGQTKDPSRYNLLRGLMENSSTVVELRDGVITVLIAGIDSVASLLSTTFWLLARDERVYQKLRTSVIDTVGQELPTYDQLKSLTYLRYVFNEGQLHLLVEPSRPSLTVPYLIAMRVYPPVPFNARVANKDTTLPYGGGAEATLSILVKKGQKVVYSSWATHRSIKSFGDDAHDFRPERWVNMKAEALGYIPFNSGPRACPGRK